MLLENSEAGSFGGKSHSEGFVSSYIWEYKSANLNR